MAQVILGPCCTSVELSRIRDTPTDDDREFFVMAWCWHPNFIEEEKIIFIPEPRVAGVAEDERTADPGLRYLVRTRVIAYQDWSMPPGTPDDLDGDNGHGNDDDDDGSRRPTTDDGRDVVPAVKWTSPTTAMDKKEKIPTTTTEGRMMGNKVCTYVRTCIYMEIPSYSTNYIRT